MKIVSMAMKSNPILQDKLVKQNEISRQILTRELEKLEKVEKSDIRMIETAWHRFRSRHKDLEHRAPSFGSNVRSCILRIKKKKKISLRIIKHIASFSFLMDIFILFEKTLVD